MTIPTSCRPFVIGKSGAVLKKIMEKSFTNIQIRQDKTDESEIVQISITGDDDGIQLARNEIEAIVSSRSNKHMQRFEIDRNLHPFIIPQVPRLSDTYSIKIHIAPIEAAPAAGKNLNEIILMGEKEQTILAQNDLLDLEKQLVYLLFKL